MTISRSQMRQQITNPPNKKKFKKKRVRVVSGNKRTSKSKLFTT